MNGGMSTELWPALRVADWADTRDTLHMWTQIVGKIRMASEPMINHWWQVPLYVSARGLTTSSMPYPRGAFDMEFDFVEHRLDLRASTGGQRSVPLASRPVADFYAETMAALGELGVDVTIRTTPTEVVRAIPFEKGRTAPPHPGGAPNCADWVMVEGYSHELSSAGFWPGFGEEGAFYAYAYPEPPGFREHPVAPAEAAWVDAAQQFLLPYEAVRRASDPDRYLLEFLQSTYEAAADNAQWDRDALEADLSSRARS
jgi:hypothetical protein